MTDRKPGPVSSVAAWVERVVLTLLLALVISGISSLANINARIDVLLERQMQLARVDAARATHESRLVAIESSRFTRADAQKLSARFDLQLLDLWKELHDIKDGMPTAHAELRDRLETVMERLEARIRALEQTK